MIETKHKIKTIGFIITFGAFFYIVRLFLCLVSTLFPTAGRAAEITAPPGDSPKATPISESAWNQGLSLYFFIQNREMHQVRDLRGKDWKSRIVFKTPVTFISEGIFFSGKCGEWVLIGGTPDLVGQPGKCAVLYFRNNKFLSETRLNWCTSEDDALTKREMRAPVLWSDAECALVSWWEDERKPRLVLVDLQTGNFSIITEDNQVAAKLQSMFNHINQWRITDTGGAHVVMPLIPEEKDSPIGYSILCEVVAKTVSNTLPPGFSVIHKNEPDYAEMKPLCIDHVSAVIWESVYFYQNRCFNLRDGKVLGDALPRPDSVYFVPDAAGPSK